MATIILIFLVIILSVACIILSVFVIEGRRTFGHHVIRHWRLAWSKRKEINSARQQAREVNRNAINASKEANRSEKLAIQTKLLAQQKMNETKRICDETVNNIQNLSEKHLGRPPGLPHQIR